MPAPTANTPPQAFGGEPGSVYANDTGKVQFQFHCNFHNSCGRCAQYDGMIGPFFPIPLHPRCACSQEPIPPGASARPFTDFREEIDQLPKPQQNRLVGQGNLKLIESGRVKWEDVVTRGRIRTLGEVVHREKLTLGDLTGAGLSEARARLALGATEAARPADVAKQAVLDRLRALGLTDDQIKAGVAARLRARIGIGKGPSGGRAAGPAPQPKPKPKASPVPPRRSWSEVAPADRRAALASALGELGAAPTADRMALIREAIVAWQGPAAEVQVHGMSRAEAMHSFEFGGLTVHYRPFGDSSDSPLFRTLGMLAEGPALPRELTRHTRELYLTPQSNRDDAYWAREFGQLGFHSGATGADGQVVAYGGWAPSLELLSHEMGHNLAEARFNGYSTPPITSPFYRAARSGEEPPTAYARHNISEDFAESVSLYATDPERLRQVAPKRYDVVRRMLEEPPNAGP